MPGGNLNTQSDQYVKKPAQTQSPTKLNTLKRKKQIEYTYPNLTISIHSKEWKLKNVDELMNINKYTNLTDTEILKNAEEAFQNSMFQNDEILEEKDDFIQKHKKPKIINTTNTTIQTTSNTEIDLKKSLENKQEQKDYLNNNKEKTKSVDIYKQQECLSLETNKETIKNNYDFELLKLKYLPQAIKLPNYKQIEKNNIEFKKDLESKKINEIKKVLTPKQKKILEHIDKRLFPLTFEKEMCRLIDKQINNYYPEIDELYKTSITNNVLVLAPDCCRIKNTDSTSTKIIKMKKFQQLPIEYISVEKILCENTREISDKCAYLISQKKYLFACADKINNTKELGIFVFFKNTAFNSNMEPSKKLSERPVRFVFFKNFNIVEPFLFGCYEFIVDFTDNRKAYYYQESINNYVDIESILHPSKESCAIKEFEKLKEKVKERITYIQNFYTEKRPYAIQSILRRTKDKKDCLLQKEKIEQNALIIQTRRKAMFGHDYSKGPFTFMNYSKYQRQAFYENINYNKDVMCIKFQEQTENNTYNILDLYNKNGFNASIYNLYFEKEKHDKIKKDFKTDIEKLGLNKYNNLKTAREHACVLVPHKFYINPEDSEETQTEKIIALKNCKVKRYHCVASAKTNKNINCYEDNKVVASFTEKISEQDLSNTIIVIIRQGFDYDGEPLLDPNILTIHNSYFYNIVDFTEKIGYPLYAFYTYPKMHPLERDVDDSIQYYLSNVPSINSMLLIDYIQECYKIFDERVLMRAQQIQKIKDNYLVIA